MKAIGIVGYKKSGKTTLLLKLAEELISRGYQVASIKHISKDVDIANSDTAKYKKYLSQVAAITTKESVLYLKDENNLETILKYLEADIVLIEGLKKEKTFPKIVCLREENEIPELFDGLQLCTASIFPPNINLEFPAFNILETEDIKKMVDMVIEKSFKLPNLNCGACGYQDCYRLAQEIVQGNKTINDCPSLEPSTLVKINRKMISMNPFIAKIVKNAIIGLLSPLKGFTKGDIEIKIKQK